jgi:acetamidase/formamidase
VTVHTVEPEPGNLHGFFSNELPPVLTIKSGDTVKYRTLDAGWSKIEQKKPFDKPEKVEPYDRDTHPGHPLSGPIAVEGAKTGMTLEVRIKAIQTGNWGWSAAGGFPFAMNTRLGLDDGPEHVFWWDLDPDEGIATSQFGHKVQLRPIIGIMGMPPPEPGTHSTFIPRFCGGNLDCKELVAGSTLFLPISVDGALFSIGDGHAVQGDGEVAGPALECPMELVELELHLHEDMHLSMPRAVTPAGWIAFGLHEDLNEALFMATQEMLTLMQELLHCEPKEALGLASLTVDFRITQAVNFKQGVHAILPASVLERLKKE